jgi:hypothetical protein
MTGGARPATRPEAVDDPPLPAFTARWGPITLSIDEKTLTALARRVVDAIPELDDLSVEVARGELSITVVVRRFGVPLSARASISQVRFKDGFLAFVLDSVDALSFIPIPDAILGFLIEKAPPGLLTYYKTDHILVVNANAWLPSGFDLALDRAEFFRREVRLHIAQGQFDLSRILGK